MKMLSRLFGLLMIALSVWSCSSKVEENSAAAEPSEVELCVGDYLTEEQAMIRLAEMSKNYQNAGDWTTRSEKIRERIYKGAGLDQIPEEQWNAPIRVVGSQMRELDGYSVENLALVKVN